MLCLLHPGGAICLVLLFVVLFAAFVYPSWISCQQTKQTNKQTNKSKQNKQANKQTKAK